LKFILAILVLTILALAGSRRVLFARSVPLGARLIFLTGAEFIFVGLLLGETYLNLIDRQARMGLEPVTAVCLGWVGLLFGLQFDFRSLKTLPSMFFAISVFQAFLTFLAVFTAFGLILWAWWGKMNSDLLLAAGTLGAAAACSGQPGLAMIQRRFPGESRQLLSFLRYVASLDALPPLILFGVMTCVFIQKDLGMGGLGGFERLFLGLGVACLIGWMLVSLGWGKTSQPELLLAVAGTCALCGGLGMQLQVSTLFLSMICGVIVANTSRVRVRMTELLARGEKFIYVVLLILAGSRLQIPSSWALVLAGIYVATRMGGKVLANYLVSRPLTRRIEVPRWIGLGLTCQAGMALAIVIDLQTIIPSDFGNEVLAVVVLGIIVNELIGPALALKVLGIRSEPSEEAS
jgi:hypothetical protein